MELRIQVPDFAKGLARVQGVVQRRHTMPILANVLIEASSEGVVELVATDLDIGMRARERAEVVRPGAVTVNARALYDIVRSLPEQEATLRRLDNNYVEVRSGRVHYRIVGTQSDEFPELPDTSGTELVEIAAKLLGEMVEKTYYSVSTDETRYNLNGVYLETKADGRLTMVSTDGHRLSRIERPVHSGFALQKGVILPRKGLGELRKLAESGDGAVLFGVKGSHAVAQHDGVTVVMRLIDGSFPDYEQVIPKQTERTAELPRSRLIDALRRISLVSSDKSHGVKIELESGLMRISSQNPELGEGQEELEIAFSGEPLVIGFNARYLIDALQAIEGEQVTFGLNDDLSPGLLWSQSDPDYLCVVMPMRI